jgi:energy-converting hydrogenase Eha subunit H
MGFIVSTLAIAGAILTSYTGGHWSVSVALVSIPVMGVVRTLVIRK